MSHFLIEVLKHVIYMSWDQAGYLTVNFAICDAKIFNIACSRPTILKISKYSFHDEFQNYFCV